MGKSTSPKGVETQRFGIEGGQEFDVRAEQSSWDGWGGNFGKQVGVVVES